MHLEIDDYDYDLEIAVPSTLP